MKNSKLDQPSDVGQPPVLREKFEKWAALNMAGYTELERDAAWRGCQFGAGSVAEERQPASDQNHALVVIELARELYDRFVMGGWEPKDAHSLIAYWAGKLVSERQQEFRRAETAESELRQAQERCKEFAEIARCFEILYGLISTETLKQWTDKWPQLVKAHRTGERSKELEKEKP